MTPEEKLQAIRDLANKYSITFAAMILSCGGDITKMPSEYRAVAYVLSEIVDIILPEQKAVAEALISNVNENDPKEVFNMTYGIIGNYIPRSTE